MSQPVVLVSRFAVKEGKLETLRPVWRKVTDEIHAGKPGTLVYLAYLDEGGRRLTMLHVLGDAESMDRLAEGSQDRSRVAFEYVAPLGWEIYGKPSEAVLETLRRAAASAGVALTIYPELVSGFVRPAPEVAA